MIIRLLAFLNIVAVGLLVLAPGAGAATFDFEAERDTLERGYSSFSLTDDGITVTATGRLLSGAPYSAFLDGGQAVLGVCKVLTAEFQCTPPNDDSVTIDEVVQLAFAQLVKATSTTFRDGGHGTTFAVDTLAGFASDDPRANAVVDFTGFDPDSPCSSGLCFSLLSSLQIIAASTFQGLLPDVNDHQLYISSITVEATTRDIPDVLEPATIGLFGLGLIALGVWARRKRSWQRANLAGLGLIALGNRARRKRSLRRANWTALEFKPNSRPKPSR